MLDAAAKSLKSKLDSTSDAAGLLWGLATLNYKADADLLTKAAGAVKSGVADLSTQQQIQTAWAMAVLGASDKVRGDRTAAPLPLPVM